MEFPALTGSEWFLYNRFIGVKRTEVQLCPEIRRLVRRPIIMGNERVYNFSAGPSMLPLEVLEQAGSEITNYQGSGMSV